MFRSALDWALLHARRRRGQFSPLLAAWLSAEHRTGQHDQKLHLIGENLSPSEKQRLVAPISLVADEFAVRDQSKDEGVSARGVHSPSNQLQQHALFL